MEHLTQRFMAKVEIAADGCWIWKGAKLPNGYGVFSASPFNEGAHRASYRLHFGPIPQGTRVRQTCGKRDCVRPDHLVLLPVGSDRFWSKVQKSDGCWTWMGARDPKGYGHYGVGKRGEGIVLAHRWAWESVHGPIPEGKCACHVCDNPSCVRPDHLFIGSHAENQRDMAEKGRSIQGEKHAMHKLTPDAVRRLRQIPTVGKGGHGKPGATYEQLAQEYGVSEATIRDAVHGRTWKHV